MLARCRTKLARCQKSEGVSGRGERWWDPRFSEWAPNGGPSPELPDGWHDLR